MPSAYTVPRRLCDLQVTSTQVSRAAAELDEELAAWRNRPLSEVTYLILDARYEKVRHGGAVMPCAVLTAFGVTPDGKRSVLGCSVARSEAETHWREFLESLQACGIHGVKLVVSDDHSGLKAARTATMPGVPWQRCQFHTIQNAIAHVLKLSMKADAAEGVQRIFNADDAAEADRRLKATIVRYHKTAPDFANWLEANIPEALTVFAFPAAHRRRLRTSNGLERLNKEIKRRTRVATLFPNEASVPRLVSAILSEISDDRETCRSKCSVKTAGAHAPITGRF